MTTPTSNSIFYNDLSGNVPGDIVLLKDSGKFSAIELQSRADGRPSSEGQGECLWAATLLINAFFGQPTLNLIIQCRPLNTWNIAKKIGIWDIVGRHADLHGLSDDKHSWAEEDRNILLGYARILGSSFDNLIRLAHSFDGIFLSGDVKEKELKNGPLSPLEIAARIVQENNSVFIFAPICFDDPEVSVYMIGKKSIIENIARNSQIK